MAGGLKMLTFVEYLEWRCRTVLPDTHTMMKLAGVSLHTPSKKQMKRALDRAKGRLVVTLPVVPGTGTRPTS